MKNHSFKILVLFCTAIFFFACNNEDDLFLDQEVTQEIVETNDYLMLVSPDKAIEVANSFFGFQDRVSGLRSSVATKSNASIETIKDQGKEPLFHIVNYPEGGWAIISATRNYYPVLAFSEKGSFEIKSDEEMGPVILWTEETNEAIKKSETLDDSTKAEIHSVWTNLETGSDSTRTVSNLRVSNPFNDAMNSRISQLVNQLGSAYGYGKHSFYTLNEAQSILSSTSEWLSLCNFANSLGSPPEYTIFVSYNDYPSQTVGPLLATEWHQGAPFNNMVPNNRSSGCGAIAVAQVMKYYNYPPTISYNGYSFNLNTIPVNPDPISYQAALVASVGLAVNMHYNSFGSWATPNAMEDGIRFFGYNVTRSNHNYNLVRTQLLTFRRPVIMGGSHNNVPLPSPADYIGKSHYWVCDGAKEFGSNLVYFMEFINPNSYTYYNHPSNLYTLSNPTILQQSKYIYFHMNWGWDKVYSVSKNGWFLHNDVNSGDGNYQYSRQDFYINIP